MGRIIVLGLAIYRSTSSETYITLLELWDSFSDWMRPERSTRVSCGQSSPHIAILNTSLANAQRILPLFPPPIPMDLVALSMRSGSSSKFLMETLRFVSSACSSAGRALSGMDFGRDERLWQTAQDNLRRKSSTKILPVWKRNFRYGLQDGSLPWRLVNTSDKLWQR